jgi:diguanylate cyclase
MNKQNAQDILKQLYNNIMVQIDSNDGAVSKDKIIDFLQIASSAVSKIDFNLPDSMDTLQEALDTDFKNLITQSLKHYNETNKSFEKLTKQQGEVIDEFSKSLINTKEITAKFTDIQTHMLNEIGKANSTILKLHNKVAELEISSQIDHLTGAYNRRLLSKDLHQICQNKIKHKDNIYMLAIDIDDFKIVNDTYGHIVGDKVLIFLANTIKKVLRDTDKVYRYGGEEFVIILNRSDEQECLEIAKRVLVVIQNNKLIYKDININITISIGITSVVDSDTPETFVQRADSALYKAKRTGKNKIIMEHSDAI